ncbi:DUF5994 family protein [Tsukamurella pulmonis]|uniref:DUF5994 family protein n=1 Tax=Tsukamurella pulmonis TaxID=47312 RepID=UPI002359EC35|nr:DUF5994 family protein [Tsukamurella pulmonis]
MRARAQPGPEALRRLLSRGPTRDGTPTPIPGRVLLPRRTALTRGIDGVWWPRSRDLQAELPTVLPSVGLKLQALECIHFSPADWTTRARQFPARDGDAIETRLLVTAGLVVFSGPRVAIIYALIAPDASTSAAEEIAARHLHA